MKKLLIIDDDPYLLDSMEAVFSGRYEVLTALSAEDGLALIEQQQIDILLLDVMLPGIDGIDLLRDLRRRNINLPVVMISAAASLQPVMNALELGACDYIRKPFDIADLRLVVARALKTKTLLSRIETLEQELARRPAIAEPGEKPMKDAVAEFERTLIKKALKRADGVQTRAAAELGITRRILRYRIEKLGL